MLQFHEKLNPQTKVLALTGQINRDTIRGIQAIILGGKEMGWQHVILDFSGITGIDSKCLGELFLWYQNMKPYDVQVSIVSPPTPIWNQLDLEHLLEIVPIYASEEEALGHTGSSS